MKSSKISLVILVIIILIAAVFLVLDKAHAPTNPTLTASSTAETVATSSIDTSAWKTYSDAQAGFSIEYPADLALSTSTIPTIPGPYLLDLQFLSADYFSTVLKDEAYVIVTASSTCPALEPAGPIDQGPQTLEFGGMTFVKNETGDVGAGNIYHTIAYDTSANGLCWRITFFDHGANGAGLYLSDPAAIQAADATHSAELANVEAIGQAMVGTFSLAASQ